MEDSLRHLKFVLSSDAMILSVEEAPSSSSTFDSYPTALELLEKLGVTAPIAESLITKLLTQKEPIKSTVIASGQKPVKGKDATFKEAIDLSSQPRYIPDEDHTAINYKEAMKMTIVAEGDLLGEVTPASEGIMGQNLRGEAIPAEMGKEISIHVGDGVEQKGTQFFATAHGAPRYHQHLLKVSNTREIKGNVNMETGNIKFPGTIIVQGDVLDGFEVESSQDVQIFGKVEGAVIKALGNIEIHGGILGKNKAKVHAQGRIQAKFCENAEVIAETGIYITKDALHCHMQTLGEIVIKGNAIGGELMALKRIEVAEAGSENGTLTKFHIHKHYRQEQALGQIKELFEESNQVMDHCRGWLKNPALLDGHKKDLEASIDKINSFITRKKSLDNIIQKFDKTIQDANQPHIIVHKKIYSDVVFAAPHCQKTLMEPMLGPLVVFKDNQRCLIEIRKS
jgi:uncharacterized protein